MIWSRAKIEKDIVIISMIGRRPTIAAPIAIPVKPGSVIGVSTTRRPIPSCRFLLKGGTSQSFLSTAYFSNRPSVTRNVPLYLPISSPIRNTSGSRSISWTMAARSASR